jgi:hypothetical protein
LNYQLKAKVGEPSVHRELQIPDFAPDDKAWQMKCSGTENYR